MIPLCLLVSIFYFQSILGFVFWTCNSLKFGLCSEKLFRSKLVVTDKR